MKAFWFEAQGDLVNVEVRAGLTKEEAREVVKYLLDNGFSMKTARLHDYSERSRKPRTVREWLRHAVDIRALEGGPYDTWEIADYLRSLGWKTDAKAPHKIVAKELKKEEDWEVNWVFRWGANGPRGRARYWFGKALGTPVQEMTRRFAPEQLHLELVG